MSHIGPIHYRDFEKFLFHIGCTFKRQKGSHRIYTRSDLNRPIVVPAAKNLSLTVIRSDLQTLKISTEKYMEILKEIL